MMIPARRTFAGLALVLVFAGLFVPPAPAGRPTPAPTKDKEEFPDMLHPNGAGYARWVEALKPVMAKLKIE